MLSSCLPRPQTPGKLHAAGCCCCSFFNLRMSSSCWASCSICCSTGWRAKRVAAADTTEQQAQQGQPHCVGSVDQAPGGGPSGCQCMMIHVHRPWSAKPDGQRTATVLKTHCAWGRILAARTCCLCVPLRSHPEVTQKPLRSWNPAMYVQHI